MRRARAGSTRGRSPSAIRAQTGLPIPLVGGAAGLDHGPTDMPGVIE
jgi:hypothetical protein